MNGEPHHTSESYSSNATVYKIALHSQVMTPNVILLSIIASPQANIAVIDVEWLNHKYFNLELVHSMRGGKAGISLP